MIKIVKLMTGEEVIAEMSMDISSIKLVNPFMLQVAPGKDGELNLALFPYAAYVLNHTVEVDAAKVLWIGDLPDSMKLDYGRALDSLSVSMKNYDESTPKR